MDSLELHLDTKPNESKQHTYIIKTLEDLGNTIQSSGYSFKKIDSRTCEITAQEDLSVTDIIEKLRLLNINVVNIISKRNRLEELFLDLTKEELV